MSRTLSREDLNDEVLNPRLQREKAKTGAITASLLWNGKSDLDLHAFFTSPATGKVHIYYRHKIASGGELDVDANARDTDTVEEPVENVYWKAPLAGEYELQVNCYAMRGTSGPIPFRLVLKLPEETLDYEGNLKSRGESITCFKYSVGDDGSVTMGRLTEPKKIMRKPTTELGTGRAAKAKAKSAGPKAKAKAAGAVMPKVKAKAKAAMKPMKAMKLMKPMKVMKAMKPMKVNKVAYGRGAKARVYKGLKTRTSGGLTKDKVIKNKAGKFVSKALSEAAKKRMVATGLVKYWQAIKKARAELGLTGFVAIKKGEPLYKRAMEIYKPDA
mmetsp:Transcript_68026/g.127034  ORF Transcript_68026/g.127034 Transcript_68026/m.127034 type:complete len:329 (-) Transcript_68026:90-1076(-)